jgi:hypothetical protein
MQASYVKRVTGTRGQQALAKGPAIRFQIRNPKVEAPERRPKPEIRKSVQNSTVDLARGWPASMLLFYFRPEISGPCSILISRAVLQRDGVKKKSLRKG